VELSLGKIRCRCCCDSHVISFGHLMARKAYIFS
jgi:hypothetical protein